MDQPRRYPYNPQWQPILICFGGGSGLLALGCFLRPPFWLGAVAGVLAIIWAVIQTFRRLVLTRELELGADALLLPTGPFQSRTTRIPYADIECAQETVRSQYVGLDLWVKGRVFSISSILLPDKASYTAISEFVRARVKPPEKRVCQAGAPVEYCFHCLWEGDGEIYNSEGEILWRVKTRYRDGSRPYFYLRWCGRNPDFIVYDPSGREWLRIVRNRRWLAGQFVMLENELPVGTITEHSPLLNRYDLDFASGSKWNFHMPFFTVWFKGASETDAKVMVRIWGHQVWYVRIDAVADHPHLVAALAFVHRERLRSN